VSDDPRSLVRPTSETQAPPGEGTLRRLTRIRAVAAAVAAGGVASLSVVLIGPPATAAQSAAPVVVVQEASSVAQPVRRPDITLGAGR
jgi:hypothetical protein